MAALCLVVIGLLAGCAGEPTFRGAEPIGDPKLARSHLQSMAAAGPIPAEIRNAGNEFGSVDAATSAARGIRWLKVVFDPLQPNDPRSSGPRLVLWFDGPRVAADVCAGRNVIPPFPRQRPELSGAWCEGRTAVAGMVGQAADDSRTALDRLTWQTTSRLFPDDYPDDFGFDMWGLRARPGGSIGF